MKQAVARPRADVTVRELLAGTGPVDGELRHYFSLEAVLPVADDIDGQIARVRSKAHRRRLRSCVRHERFDWTLSTDAVALELLYDRLYEPFGRSRFGALWQAQARSAVFDLLRRRDGRVLLGTPKGGTEPVCGAFLFREAEALVYHFNAFAPTVEWASPAYSDLTAALELEIFRHAIASRVPEIQLGFARAVLSDGLFTHKRRLGCSFSVTPGSPSFGLSVAPRRRAAVFGRFPMLSGTPGQFVANLGYDSTQPQLRLRRWRRLLHRHMLPSVAAVRLYTDVPANHPGLQTFLEALREVAGATPVTIEEHRAAA